MSEKINNQLEQGNLESPPSLLDKTNITQKKRNSLW